MGLYALNKHKLRGDRQEGGRFTVLDRMTGARSATTQWACQESETTLSNQKGELLDSGADLL